MGDGWDIGAEERADVHSIDVCMLACIWEKLTSQNLYGLQEW